MNLPLLGLITLTAWAHPAMAGEPAGTDTTKYFVLDSRHPHAPTYIIGQFSEIQDEANLNVFVDSDNKFDDNRRDSAFSNYTLEDLKKHIATLTGRKIAWVTLGKFFNDDDFQQQIIALLKQSGFQHIYLQGTSGGVAVSMCYINNSPPTSPNQP